MCGIFGFIANSTKHGPSLARLQRIALATQTRGTHAFGLAWIDADGKLQTLKRPLPASDCLADLEELRDAVALIGHCRYATHGSPSDDRNNHPHPAGAGAIVHNGVVANYAELCEEHDLTMVSECDSEVLGLLIGHRRGSILARGAWAANQAVGELAILGLWANPVRVLVVRRGRPLACGIAREGVYWASLPTGLPTPTAAVCDATARALTLADGTLRNCGDPAWLEPDNPRAFARILQEI